MRLKEAHGHFSARDESSVWGVWPGDEGIWNVLKEELEVVEKRERGDWRVSHTKKIGLSVRFVC